MSYLGEDAFNPFAAAALPTPDRLKCNAYGGTGDAHPSSCAGGHADGAVAAAAIAW